MENIPWQVIACLIVLGIIAILAIVIIVVSKNKNLSANAKVKDTDLGFSITDGGSDDKNKSSNKKNVMSLTREDNVNLSLIRLNMLRIHPIFSTSFNHIFYKSEDLVEFQKIIVLNYFSDSKKQVMEKIAKKLINKYMIVIDILLKNYIMAFKETLHNIMDNAEIDIVNDDMSFENTRKSLNVFMGDVSNDTTLISAIDNFKCTGVDIKNTHIQPSSISDEVFNTFQSFIKNESLNFYRDLMLAKNMIFSIDSNPFERYVYFINGIEQLLNSVLQYTFILGSETKYKIIFKLCSDIDNTETCETIDDSEETNNG